MTINKTAKIITFEANTISSQKISRPNGKNNKKPIFLNIAE